MKLRRQLDDTRTALQASGTASTVHGRATDSGDAWPPQVLLIADPSDALHPGLTALEAQLTDAPSSGFAVGIGPHPVPAGGRSPSPPTDNCRSDSSPTAR